MSCNDKDIYVLYNNSSYCFSPEEVKMWFEIPYAKQESGAITENIKKAYEMWKKTQPRFLISQLNGMVDFNFKDAIKHGNNKFEFKASNQVENYYLSKEKYNLPYHSLSFKILEEQLGLEIKEVVPSSSMLQRCYSKKDLSGTTDIVFDNNTIVFYTTTINKPAWNEILGFCENWFQNPGLLLNMAIEPEFMGQLTKIVKKYYSNYANIVCNILKNLKVNMGKYPKDFTFVKFMRGTDFRFSFVNELQTANTDSYNCFSKTDLVNMIINKYAVNQESFKYNRYIELENKLQHQIGLYQANPNQGHAFINHPLFQEYLKLANEYRILIDKLKEHDKCFHNILYLWIDESLIEVLKNNFNTINLVEMPYDVTLLTKDNSNVKTSFYKACPSSRYILEKNDNDVDNLNFETNMVGEYIFFQMMEDEKERKPNERKFRLINVLTNKFVDINDIENKTILESIVKTFDFGIEKKIEYYVQSGEIIETKVFVNNNMICQQEYEDNECVFFVFGQEYTIGCSIGMFVYSFDFNNIISMKSFKNGGEERYRNILAKEGFFAEYVDAEEGEARLNKDIFIKHYLTHSTGIKLKDTPSRIIVFDNMENKKRIQRGAYVLISTFLGDDQDNLEEFKNQDFEDEITRIFCSGDEDMLILYKNMNFKGDGGSLDIPVKIGQHTMAEGLTFIICDDLVEAKILFATYKTQPKFLFFEIEEIQDSIRDEDVENEGEFIDEHINIGGGENENVVFVDDNEEQIEGNDEDEEDEDEDENN